MKTRITIAALTTAVAAFSSMAAFAGSDPASTLQADLTTLQGQVGAAHDTLLADLGKITSDAGKLQGTTDKAAVKSTLQADLKQFRSDRSSAMSSIQADRAQLKSDLQAVKAAKVDPSTIKPLLQAARAQDKAALAEVHQAAQNARDAVRALRQSFKSH
jgi:hypothetical protein